MPQENQHDYYLRREQECRDAAERTSDPAIRQTHLNFAQLYADRIVTQPIPPHEGPI
ncbi:hypothetical protein [Sphingomonas colocasiae]|uniref:Uncharacterized protein n=1 Tax=Sphingomonas colocasiae TaxID=1848973 RepID=A0ABS7PUT0_9SPHN|nr:hypothetical protein [Sphingomonas colocasiae]MBY8825028.1 hypothetical protein [Sphingomonas colocasiae]